MALGRHMNAPEVVDYDKLSPRTRKRVDEHLLECKKCHDRFARFQEVCKAWEGPEGEKRLDDFAKRIRTALRFVRAGSRSPVKPRKGSCVVIPMTRKKA